MNVPQDLLDRLIAQLPQEIKLKGAKLDLQETDYLEARCNGEKEVESKIANVILSKGKGKKADLFLRKAIFFENDILGKRIGFLPQNMIEDSFAETLVDSSCAAAGCNNGQNCALKRQNG